MSVEEHSANRIVSVGSCRPGERTTSGLIAIDL